MARYDIAPAWFQTPRGRPCLVYIREDTNDWNTAYSALNEDEYGLRGLEVAGTFIDIGGHLGTVALGILLDNPDALAVIVEPIPENLLLIQRNLTANGVAGRATIIAGAVGDGEVTIRYAFDGGENELHHAYVGNGVGTIAQATTPHSEVTYTALGYRDVLPFGEASLVKIDCEGGEWPVLAQLAGVPVVVGEIHPTPVPDGVGSPQTLRDALAATHDITVTGSGPWGFRAVLHAGADLSTAPALPSG